MISMLVLSRKLPALALCLVLAGAGSAFADDKAYDIKFHHAVKVGDKFKVSSVIETSLSRQMEADGNAKKDVESLSCTLAGEMTISAVDKLGRETAFQLVVQKLEAGDKNTPSAEVLPAGSTVDVTYDNKTAKFTLKADNPDLSPLARKALTELFRPPHSDLVEDDMFGTGDKKKVGDSWDVNAKNIATDAGGESLTLDPVKITGKTTLSAVKDFAGTPALELQAKVAVAGITVPDLGESKDATVAIDISEKIPVDPGDPSSVAVVKDQLHAAFTKEVNGKKMTLTIESAATHNETRTLIK